MVTGGEPVSTSQLKAVIGELEGRMGSILYDNPGGATQSVTVSGNLDDFRYVQIDFGYDVGYGKKGFRTVVLPVGKIVNQSTYVIYDKINNSSAGQYGVNRDGNRIWFPASTPTCYIFRVIGIK